jgi:hypothetical protein
VNTRLAHVSSTFNPAATDSRRGLRERENALPTLIPVPRLLDPGERVAYETTAVGATEC